MKSIIASSVVILLVLSGCGSSVPCEPISTQFTSLDFTQDTTIPAGCWLVDENIYVSNNAVLTVAPGTTLKFAANTGIVVDWDGALSAGGTAGKHILFTGQQKQRGFWNGIVFENSASIDNKLDYVTVEYAGAEARQDWGANTYRSAVTFLRSSTAPRASITRSTIRQSAGFGLYIDFETTLSDFTGNTITKNASGAVYAYADVVHNLSASSSYTGNDSDHVFVNAAYDFEVDRTWANLGVPYHVDGVFILYHKLTLEAGTTLKFTSGSYIEINDFYAAIEAIGTSDNPIVFTGTEATPGHWGGLNFVNTNADGDSTVRSHLNHVVIEYGGGKSYWDSNAAEYKGNLMLSSSGWNSLVELSNSTIQNSTGYGVWKDCLSDLTGTGNTYSSNEWGATGLELNCG